MTESAIEGPDIASMTAAARSVIGPPGRLTVISKDHPLPEIDRTEDVKAPPYDLFHFPFSMCSNKVRAVLAELGLSWSSNQFGKTVNWEHYTPDYVRLRLQSDAAKNSGYVTGYSGASAVEEEGFDPCVVPTFVDNGAGKVIADSKQICLYIARSNRDAKDLLPEDLEDDVIAQMDAVDRTPHVALLYGANPDGDTRPEQFQKAMPGIHRHKIEMIESLIDNIGEDPELESAYRAKIAKEAAASGFVNDETAMRRAIALTKEIVVALEASLQKTGGPWIFGDRFTMADLMWGISLIRLQLLGYDSLWTGAQERPDVRAYVNRVRELPSLKSSVIDWR